MIKILFNGILTILTSLIQIVVIPVNGIITSLLPDISQKVQQLSTGLSALFTGGAFAISFVPHTLIVTLLFIISVEIAKYSIFISTHVISLILNIIKRIKFW